MAAAFAACLFLPAGYAATKEILQESLFAMSLAELAQISVVTAARTPQPSSKSPASVSVITARQICNMGARDIYDVLRHVSGIRIDKTNRGSPIIAIRGVRKDSSDYVLIMLNGHVLNEPANGSATFLFDLSSLPLYNIERIEVVRGPGSSLYGANAFLGMINIITKSPEEIDGVETGFRTEFEDEGNVGQEYNLLFGKRFKNDVGVSMNINVLDVAGAEIFVESDMLGRSGYVDNEVEQLDAQGSVEAGILRIDGRYLHRKRGEFFGPVNVLSPDSSLKLDAFFLDLALEFEAGADTDVRTSTYVDHGEGKANMIAFPAGSIPPGSPLSPFNEVGFYGTLELDYTKAGAEALATYKKWQPHALSVGAAYEYQSQDNLKVSGNDDGSGVPLDPPRDTTDVNNFGEDAHREVAALFVEDAWEIGSDAVLNTGVRLDDYSDFGSSLNPRIGLIWGFVESCSFRVLYGTAFRAPDFRSLYVRNNPVVEGNPNLKPEEIRTWEIGVDGCFLDRFRTRATYFHNDLEELIATHPEGKQLDNVRSVVAQGVEVEGTYEFANGSYVSANYTYTDSEVDGASSFSDIPRNSGSVIAGITPSKHLHSNITLYWQDETRRADGDARRALDGYEVLNLNLLFQGCRNCPELQLSVYNLFDEEYAFPDRTGSFAGDFPAPGRSFVIGLKYRI